MSYRSREGLGRNRGGPATRNMVPAAILGCILMVGLGIAAYRYLTAPQRVFGAKALHCSGHELQWTGDGTEFEITGCGRSVKVVCIGDPPRCMYPDEVRQAAPPF